MKTILYWSFLIFSLFAILSCQRELSGENNQNNPSTGSLQTLAGECMPSSINGLFKENAATDITNYLNVEVNVSAIGTYLVVSDTLNGIYFKGAGVFTTTGLHRVQLRASGIPFTDGTFPFAISYGGSTCIINVVVLDASVTAAIYTLGAGTGGACTGATANGIYKAATLLDATNTINITLNITTAGSYSISTVVTNGIIFSGSGIVIQTGNQVIVLNASGTPVTAGNTVITLVNGSSTCSFPLTILPSGTSQPGVFSLGGAGSTCTCLLLNGAYRAGVAMVATNTAKIDVNVTTIGTYTISTTAINGITFTGTGTFTTAGAQQVTLNAAGTPSAGGNFNLTVTLNSTTCTFPITFLAAAQAAVFTLSGSPGNCLNPVINGVYTTAVAMNSTNTVVIKTDVTQPGPYSIVTNTVNGVSFTASGVFAAAGAGISVTLTASGTLIAAGTFTFTPQVGASTCTFNITTVAAAAGIFNCKIDGVFTSFHDRAEATTTDLSGNPNVAMSGYVSAPNGNTVTELQLSINNNNTSAVKTGTYNVDGWISLTGYYLTSNYTLVNPDLSVTIWGTSSTFTTPNPPFTITVTSVSLSRVKGTFSGKVTNSFDGSTIQKTITEGVFDLPIN